MNREAGVNALIGMGVAFQMMILAAVFLVLRFIWRSIFKKTSSKETQQPEAKTKKKIGNLEEEKLYELAMDELDSGNVRRGIWAKAVAQSNGNDNQAGSKYLELRVGSLKDEAHSIQSILEPKPVEPKPDLVKPKPVEPKPKPVEPKPDLVEPNLLLIFCVCFGCLILLFFFLLFK